MATSHKLTCGAWVLKYEVVHLLIDIHQPMKCFYVNKASHVRPSKSARDTVYVEYPIVGVG